EDSCEPLGDSDERVEVDAGVDPFAMEQVDKILGRDVPGGAGSKGAATEAAHRGREDRGAGLERSVRVRHRRVPRVVEVDADGHAEALRPSEEPTYLPRHAHTDRVGEENLLRAGLGAALR